MFPAPPLPGDEATHKSSAYAGLDHTNIKYAICCALELMNLPEAVCRAKVDHTREVPGTRPASKDTWPLPLHQRTPENSCLLGHGASLSAACQ